MDAKVTRGGLVIVNFVWLGHGAQKLVNTSLYVPSTDFPSTKLICVPPSQSSNLSVEETNQHHFWAKIASDLATYGLHWTSFFMEEAVIYPSKNRYIFHNEFELLVCYHGFILCQLS